MGQSNSSDGSPRQASTEQLSHELALRFATKCFSPLELTHLKDNFRTLADEQDGLKYWKEETLCKFLCLPDVLGAGQVLFQMASNLGAFPFPSLAPSIMTLESMVKVVVIMTERYSRTLKRGRKDRVKLLFRSLAVFDRRLSAITPSEKPTMEDLVAEQKPDDMLEGQAAMKEARSHVAGFAVDEPANDDEEDEDDDELALAALDSLDAIEVFKQDQKSNRKINHAQIPVGNLKRLVVLILVIAPLQPLESIAQYFEGLTKERLQRYEAEADNIAATFEPDPMNGGITYQRFTTALTSSVPYLFEPLNALFEHFLFSKNIDLSKRRASSVVAAPPPTLPSPRLSPIILNHPEDETLLTESMLAHLSTFMVTSSATTNLFHSHTRFHPLYSTATHGTSLTSFSREVLSWQAPTLLLVSGSSPEFPKQSQIIVGAYIPSPWSKKHNSSSISPHESPSLFILGPRHAWFPANPYHRSPTSDPSASLSAPFTHFSTKTGISIGCIIPPSSRTGNPTPIPGPISLQIDPDIASALFTYTPHEGTGAFLPDPSIPPSKSPLQIPEKLTIEISTLSIYGLSTPEPNDIDGEDEIARQKKRLAWEEAEAERRRGVNFGGDKEGARALLEMAGIVGEHAGRSGGSV